MTKPRSIVRAAQLLYIAIVVDVVQTASAPFLYPEEFVGFDQYVLFLLFGSSIAYLGLLLLFTIKISAGRNWARISFYVLFILTLPSTLLRFREWVECCGAIGYISLLSFVCKVLAVTMLAGYTSTAWFRAKNRGI